MELETRNLYLMPKTIDELKSYQEVIDHFKKESRKINLLIGNGFSIAYDKDIFSYNALNRFVMDSDDEVIKKVFQVYNTQNFESIMQQLQSMIEVLKILDAPSNLCTRVAGVSRELKSKLIDAITAMHPEQVFKVDENKSKHCADFLRSYIDNGGHIFSTDYDLLLYWVLLRNGVNSFIDGFGREAENIDDGSYIPEDEIEWSELIWGKYKHTQNVHYLHGALPLFDEGKDIIKVEYNGTDYLLDVIKKKIDNGSYPVFVAAGTSNEKMQHISHNKYLNFCYDSLCQIKGSLVVLGFSFGDNDTHIIDAINQAGWQGKQGSPNDKLVSVYVGVFSEADYQHMQSIKNKFRFRMECFDARTAHIWE